MAIVARTTKALGGVGLNSKFKALIAPMMVLTILSGCKVSKKAAAQVVTEDSSVAGPSAPVPAPAPSPGVGTIATATLAGAAAVASNFDVSSALQLAWGTGQLPGSAAPDVMGAFRFICGAGQLKYDDPIMYPGQPGKSHLHQFFGNTAADANSTFSSLRSTGDSTCNWTGNGTAANRSSYWMPAMLDGKGNVVRPDLVSIYYKQVADQNHVACAGKCINIPNGLRFIYGWDPTGVNSAKTGAAYFNCQGPTAKPGHYPDLTNVKEWCGPGNQLGAIIEAPSCWDGKNLDSADHRSHVAYECSATHPYRFPQFTQGVWYTVGAGEDPSQWHLSSDHMAPGKARGYTYHADYFEAWDPAIKGIWWSNCLMKLRNASGGDLCNGQQLKGAAQPVYNGLATWTHPQRLVPRP